jgi:hypothetical protein
MFYKEITQRAYISLGNPSEPRSMIPYPSIITNGRESITEYLILPFLKELNY